MEKPSSKVRKINSTKKIHIRTEYKYGTLKMGRETDLLNRDEVTMMISM